MQILKQKITEFLDSNIAETIPAYNPTTTYDAGDEVLVGSYTYKSLIDGNVGNEPIKTQNVKWIKWGVSNKFSMLDLAANTKSVLSGDSLVVEFTQNTMDTIVIGNYEASTITVEIFDNLGTLKWSYDTTLSLNEYVNDWWDWTYEDYNYEVDRALMIKLGFLDRDATVKVTFNYDPLLSSQTACGYLIGGNAVDMGHSLYGVGFKFNSFTTKSFDTFGTFSMKKRSVQDLVDFNTIVKLNKKPLMTLKREIKAHYDDIVAFIVDETAESRFENIITLGIIQDASVALNNGVIVDVAWSVAEVI